MVHWVDRLPTINIASYVDLDVRLGWRPDPRWELAIVGQNLLRPWRKEYEATLLTVDAIQVRRAVYGSITSPILKPKRSGPSGRSGRREATSPC
jgi:iron complex outermembrane receptor protein